MEFKKYIFNPQDRILATHFVVIFILVLNILFFTHDEISIILQTVLIFAVILHHLDDVSLSKYLKNAEKRLIEETNIFDRNIIVSESDLAGNITYANQNFCNISGYTREELIGRPHSILRDPEASPEMFKELWETIQSGKTHHIILKNIRKDGTYYWIDASISPIINNGKITGYKAIRFDITNQILANEHLELQQQQQASLLKKQSSRFEFAINSSRDGFWDYDIVNKEFYLSSGWKKRLGFKEDEVVTYLDYLSLIPDEHRFEHHQAMHDMLEEFPNELEYVHFRIRYTLITKAGEKILIEDVGDAFFDENKSLTRITGFHRDITDIDRQNKIIESQNRMTAMGEMIGNIAHQWRQPIGAINNVLNDLEFDIELEELETIKSVQFLEVSKKVKEYTSYLSQTIDDFRSISSNEKVKSEFYIKDVLNEAYNIVASEYEKNDISLLSVSFEDCICSIIGYRRELMQVFLNIFNNAKDALLQNNIVHPKVVISFMKTDKEIMIFIHDNAGGIPESIQEKIFDPYFTTKHESVGTGIGLYMSKKIITEHFKGKLTIENEHGGAKFTIALPRQNP
jgi:PAS domain S-box-containing protein